MTLRSCIYLCPLFQVKLRSKGSFIYVLLKVNTMCKISKIDQSSTDILMCILLSYLWCWQGLILNILNCKTRRTSRTKSRVITLEEFQLLIKSMKNSLDVETLIILGKIYTCIIWRGRNYNSIFDCFIFQYSLCKKLK